MNKTITIKDLLIILMSVGLLYFIFTNNSNSKYIDRNIKELKKENDSINNVNDMLTDEIVSNQERIKASEQIIYTYEKKYNQTISKLSQIQNNYINEKNNSNLINVDSKLEYIRTTANSN